MLTNYRLEIFWESGCCGAWQCAVAELSEDIDAVLPHLESALKGSVYEPNKKILWLAKGGADISVYPKKIIVDYILNEGEARALVDWLKDMINETYERIRGGVQGV